MCTMSFHLLRSSCANLLPFTSIVESAVVSFVVLAPRKRHLSWTRRTFRLSTLPVVRPSQHSRPLHRRFSLHACATGAMPKSMVQLLLTPLPRPLPARHHYPGDPHLPVLVAHLPRDAHKLSPWHCHRRILRFPMTYGITLFGSVPISAKPPEVDVGRPSLRPFPIT
jgi:hypothetical protein